MDSPLSPKLTPSLLLRGDAGPAAGDAPTAGESCMEVFDAMLIQFIFNGGTVGAHREATEISALVHFGKSIAHLFILLFELCV